MSELNPASLQALVTLGENIEIARRRRRLNQKAICFKADITPQTYRRLIQGDAGISLGVVFRVCQTMGIESLLGQLLDPRLDEAGKQAEAKTPDYEIDDNGRCMPARRPKTKQPPPLDE
ncbi:helix-turn-helix transcriptional regulator [Pseudomonas fluorescens]|uniref:helix-turn-helix transcriptional regulator n=1 Tax=Pseudomonas TaxID=286 RepID=UPI000F032035|nr:MULTISPECIES: helix-turn-helix domain-containing protein [Pseudomonas]MBD8089106.1 helix-turn-helix transcriptional regulator [Pseudomonas fluorescens]MBD8615468.1 helix-turn-helix transcriptional regulator [Pseudomonas putida]MBD8681879.1 helix-turn-helix transcriptional regulator [Pseudomonas sp. CFBP 13719]